MRNWKLVLALALSAPAWAGQINVTGDCESRLLRESFASDLSEGTVHIGRFAELEKTLRAGNVPEQNVVNIVTILEGAKSGKIDLGPFADTLQMLKLLKLEQALYVCVEQKDCKNLYGSSGAAYYLKYEDQVQLSYKRFAELPAAGTSEWLEFQMESEARAHDYAVDHQPRALVVKPFSEKPEGAESDPLGRINTLEGAFFHEAQHAGDAELFKTWVVANKKLMAKGEAPDELFKKYVRCGEVFRRCYVAQEFYSLFSEARAYYLTLLVRNLFTPREEKVTEDMIFFTAWMAIAHANLNYSATEFDIFKEEGLPSSSELLTILQSPDGIKSLAAKMRELTLGPKSWANRMKQTINRAF